MERYERLKEFLRACPVEVRFSEPMARHTSLGIGGPADAAVFPDEDAVKALIPFLRDEGIPYTVIGKGTNVLVRDEGIRGAVIFTDNLGGLVFDACRDIPCADRRTGEALLVARGGCALRQVMRVSLRHGLSGIEGLVGIPGSVGGAVAGNAGAFGCEIKDVIQSLRLLMPGGEVRDLARKEMSFGYRTMTLPEGAVILAAALALQRDDPHEVRRRMKGFMAEKRSRQPVGEHSAGCVFKNPAGTSAGKLIDEAGCKGMAVGAVMVSPVHANFFVNGGDGTAKDFTALMEAVGERVRRRSGIELEPEIWIIGEGA